MGYLLKEALKTLCGVNQWSYAVFWKIGCQNPKLLIWEECYYGPASRSGLPGISVNGNSEITFPDYNAASVSAETLNLRSDVPEGDKVQFLVNKMMMDNHVNILGEGLVGRVAFTGNHQWILSDNYYRETHPPEVLKEVCQQFSAGMQTVTVIPILPHGVAQFGSYLTIAENMGFVNNVMSLILQLGYLSGGLQSENYAAKELAPKIVVPVCPGYSTLGELPLESNMMSASSFTADSFNYVGCSVQTSLCDSQVSYPLHGEIQNEMQLLVAAFQASDSSLCHLKPHDCHGEAKFAGAVKLDFSSSNQFMDVVAKAEVNPSNSGIWMNQHSSLHIPRPIKDLPSSSSSTLNHSGIRCIEQKFLSDSGSQGAFVNPMSAGIQMSAIRTNAGLIVSSDEGSVGLPSVEASRLCEHASSNMKPVQDVDSLLDGNKAACENITSKHPTSSGHKILNLSKMDASFSDSVDHLTTNSLLTYCSGSEYYHMNKKLESELNPSKEEVEQSTIHVLDVPLNQHKEHLNMAELIPSCVKDHRKQKIEGQNHSLNNTSHDDACAQPQSGDDLFDIFGADFKNKLFGTCWSSHLSNESDSNTRNCYKNYSPSKRSLVYPEMYSTSQGNSDSGIFSFSGTDNLLDAVVSKFHPSGDQSLDDNVSCRTTLTNISSSPASKASLPYGRFGVSDHMKEELLGIPKYLAKAGAMSSSSFRTVPSKEDPGTYSQASSIYDSWIEKGLNMKQSNSVATAYSKKRNETSKPNRKRLKPGENPRPRPKDRQMIQDRVKELREIVPNGAKCSIDALLERTIKHMLFLQSVTKHADKIKQTADSKISSKDGGLLLEDNFEGGATWAYEVGSQSMVCPIIVEDLNQPRQMLVEMLCEERGAFLEIAEIIRGLGLTILKGLMETRNDKIWARFAVEANRDVTRMEVFLSLVRLLEQSAKGGIPQLNNSSKDKMMVQQFHQAAPVPVTGRSHSLQ